jgi:molybdate transport system substrate-binding protein
MLKKQLWLSLLLLPWQIANAEIKVAVASNFTYAMQEIAQLFEQQTGHDVTLISGSTGKIYAQIVNGAPFDAFFSADAKRPEKLEKHQLIQANSRFSYALGELVLWSPNSSLVDKQGKVLSSPSFRHLAIANPKLAPYGLAAQQVLEAEGVWPQLETKVVRGENISQAFHFVISQNAELGFIALSQLKHPTVTTNGSHWLVPKALYSPIEQQAVQLTDKAGVRALLDFVKSEPAQQVIRRYGYSVP